MMRLPFSLFAVLTLGLVAFGQTRSVTVNASNYTATSLALDPLPDGGCAARWCGEVTTSEGATERACTELVELRAAANRSRCADLLTVGAPRVLRVLRFPVDAGLQ